MKNFQEKFLILLTCWNVVESLILPTINWDPRNPIFKKNDCHDKHAHLSVDMKSRLTFVCPSVVIANSVMETGVRKSMLYENMYMVTKKEFEDCSVTNTSQRILMCNEPRNPGRIKYRMLYFSDLTASNQLRFSVNETYYFIAVSNGTKSGLENKVGGRCKTNNMRLAISICGAGENCYSKYPPSACRSPAEKKEETNVVVSETEKLKEKEVPKVVPKVIKPEDIAPKVGASQKVEPAGGDSDTTILAVCVLAGLLAGIIAGAAIVIGVQHVLKKRSDKPIPDNGEVFTVEVQEDPMETLRREANRKYFKDDNAAYRNSTEFKRLLSTSSGSSSERYSVVKVAEP